MKYRITQHGADGEVLRIKTAKDASLPFVAFGLAIPGEIHHETAKIVIEKIEDAPMQEAE